MYSMLCNKLSAVYTAGNVFSWKSRLLLQALKVDNFLKKQVHQGIIDMNRNGNSANFFSYVCNGKKIKELFASTLDRIPISVRCVSSMIIVLNAKFALLLAAYSNKKHGEIRRSPTSVPCFAS